MVEPIRLSKEEAAAAAWTLVTEPGDEAAGLLRLTFGSQESFGFLTDGVGTSRILSRLKDSPSWRLAESRFGDVRKTIEDSLNRWQPRVNQTEFESALKLAQVCKAKFLTLESEDWPASLSDLGLATPAGLWVRGSLERLTPAIAIVGSRAATNYGSWVCADLVSAFETKGIALVSGGAFGIDAAAHQHAIALGLPNFAVMAGGVDRFYPASNRELLGKVAELGAVFSELPPGRNPTRWRFLQRNRLIAALARAVVVVEAGYRSGAINTANHAVNLGRPLAAVPGSVQSATSLGCHRLIRDGLATLVSTPQEVLELAGFASQDDRVAESLGSLELRALDALTGRYQSLTSLAVRGGFTNMELAIALGGLELAGLAERDAANTWRRRLNL